MSSQILKKLILFDIFIVLGNKKALEKIDKEDAKIAKEAIDYFEQMLRMKSIFLLKEESNSTANYQFIS